MHPIIEASRLMQGAQITRKAAVHANGGTIFLWELSTGGTIETIRSMHGFSSTGLKAIPFIDRVNYYSAMRGTKVTGSFQLQA
ncbi:TPA: hypothetical protein ACRNDU_005619 [Pseudomonas aeruginosa]|uniref:Uncharacterized protein n=1 Tax=Pseudomonas juntendi TaxID=2666183 RepID=A0ABD4YLY8_9PSED|nr:MULTISPECIES: hypothetical protein [Pseudomonas]MDH0760283.1 hypothetical protein [Pseudomonas juntendi]MDH1922293.1 hypothetical protein [Pseudomonas juntendi]TRO35300.1 hypothetical protein EQ845_12715 [Pseudomonas putida]